MNHLRETAEIDEAARDRPVGIDVPAFEDFAQVVQRLQDRALSSAVRTEEQRYGSQLDPLPRADAFEVLNLDPGQAHSRTSKFAAESAL
jgi:hypothetical protein